jgi:hypothetical protein
MHTCTITLTSKVQVKFSDDGRFCHPKCPQLRFPHPGIGYDECSLIDLNNKRMIQQTPVWDPKTKQFRRTKRCRQLGCECGKR